MKKSLYLFVILLSLSMHSQAQNVAMADGLRSEGKIYVVVLVIGIITLGLFGYLFYLDKKLTKKEKHRDE